MDWRLVRVHLRAHRGVDAVGADQQRALHFAGGAVAFDESGDAVFILAVAGDAARELYGVLADALDDLVIEQHVKLAAVHGILRPVVAGELPARLGINVVAVQPDQGPFLGRQADAV